MDPDQRVVAIRRTAGTTSGRIVEVNEAEIVVTGPATQARATVTVRPRRDRRGRRPDRA